MGTPIVSAITVYVSGRPSEAHLVAGLLQANDIAAMVVNDQLISQQPFLSFALGGVLVQVPESQVESAQEILREHLGPTNGNLHVGAMSFLDTPDTPPASSKTNPSDAAPSVRQLDGRLLCKACEHINEPDSVYCEECGSFIKPLID
jgi:hypothetical protein